MGYKTPDVYVEEIPVFPPSVAEVGTAIPAFVGHTEMARKKEDDDLLLVPTKIHSLAEYESLFGGPHAQELHVSVTEDAATGAVTEGSFSPKDALPEYFLYWAVRMYFDNGGGECYIVSTGGYDDAISLGDDGQGLQGGLKKVAFEDEPTLLVIPEAVRLGYAHYKGLAQAMLKQCGELMDRFAILDVWNGDKSQDEDVEVGEDVEDNLIDANRAAWDSMHLRYGAAYYPFLKTVYNPAVAEDESNVKVKVGEANEALLSTFKESKTSVYNAAKTIVSENFIMLPPSGAVSGVYAAVDGARGVWKAPANVGLASVLGPVVKLDSKLQEGLNVDPGTGKSINAIRAFAAKGTYVWGARTLAGNDNEWRYIPVRRFFNTVEESLKKSTSFAVFEPNDANLWVKVRGMIENYLIDKWREGALAGAAPKDAFYVKCGLGTTMSAQDILEGRLNVEIGLAVVRPAEFIVLKFSHKLQTS